MHIKDDFQRGAPISQVSADWFNSVAKFINGLIPGKGIVFDKHCDGEPTVISVDDKFDAEAVDNTNASDEGEDPEVFGLTFTDWTSGNADGNGVKLRLYSLVEEGSAGAHILQPLDFEISAAGVIKSVKVPTGDHGIWLG